MAIHAHMYAENLGFPLMSSQDFAGENGRGVGGGIGQFCQNPLQRQQWRKWEEEKQFHKQSTAMQIQNQNQCLASNFQAFPLEYSSSSSAIIDQVPLEFHQSIASYVARETAELHQYIKLQNERLAWALQEQVKQQILSVLKRIESKTMFLLRQKEEEIVQATKKAMELEEFMRKLETENQAWQRVAQENEAMVISLSNTLDQMRETASCCFRANAAEDAESCCDMNNVNGETEEAAMDANRGGRQWPTICSSCNSRKSCVLFLPCRHLCSCKACEAVLDSCPVCFTGKSASIEALIF